ncbi:13085_t:CDS:1 [Cetraspora pellucida]|uniref:13085_t:CDS:1 n=1 Tax=Cetraspora pellucida TaxID=1433469 RepID=A0A9N8W863_9GLOM|nr:13085_t:CDS:1 [Cetraspora pellucida]
MWLYFCSFVLLICVNWHLQKHENINFNIDDHDNLGNINRTKSISNKTIASLKRRSSIRKGSLKLKGGKRYSQIEDSSSSRKAFMGETSRSFEMSETSPRSFETSENSPRLFEMSENSPRLFEMSETSPRSFEISENEEKEKENTDRLGVQVVSPERVVEIVHQDCVFNDEYVTYGNTHSGDDDNDNIQSNPVIEDSD